MIRSLMSTIIVLAVVVLAGCGSSTPDATTPDGATTVLVGNLKTHNLRALVRAAVPPAEYTKMSTEWDAKRTGKFTEQDKAQFADLMGKLTAPNAEATLFAMAQPHLAEAQQSLAFGGMMLAGMLGKVTQNDKMTAEERVQAQKVVGALTTWISTLRIDDEAKLKQAIAIAVKTARELKITTHDQMLALDMGQMLDKGSIALGGVTGILAIYGLDIDATVNSMAVGSPAIDGATAKVPLTMTFLGQQLTSTGVLKLVNGSWYPDTKEP